MSDRLTKLAMFYDREAKKCVQGRAYLAGCVMQGAALEAMLHSMCFLFPGEVKRTIVYRKKRFRRKRNKALDFNLTELIKIADELGWFPSKKVTWGKRTTLAGFAHELRNFRNHVHAAVWAPKQPETIQFSKRLYGVAREIFDVAHSWLLYRIRHDLAKRIERAEMRSTSEVT